MRSFRAAALIAAAVLIASGAAALGAKAQPLSPADLLTLKELGAGRGGLALSPDGTRLAIMERTTDLTSDDYHYDLIVLAARANARPAIIGDGGSFILDSHDGRRSGASAARTPLWSPDARYIAYLAERAGRVELWLSSANGRLRRRLAGAEADVAHFAWCADSAALIVETATPRRVLAQTRTRGRLEGFRVDARYEPGYSLEALPDEDALREVFTIDLAGRRRALAPGAETAFLSASPSVSGRASAQVAPIDAQSRAAAPEKHVMLTTGAGQTIACTDPLCRGDILAAWASEDGRQVVFQREEGPARDLNAFYLWDLNQGVRLIRRAEERMMACALARGRIFCLQEFASQPRRIVTLAIADGALGVVYDPNPDWNAAALPRIERIDLAAGRFEASYAHLVYPNDYEPGRRYPLIVTQYRSRGFLRGGTGNQLPIFAAAARGYFVASLERPQARTLERVLSVSEIAAQTELNGDERAMKLDQLDRIIANLTERGLIDPERVALTGMSDGAETLYAAIARPGVRYAAAAVGSQPIDPLNWYLTSQNHRTQMRRDHALVGPDSDARGAWPDWWRANAIVNHSGAITTPLMFHLSQSEAIFAMPLVVRLDERASASEAYIYPGAYHLKWRPRQILAMQQRTLAWFEFWLRDGAGPANETDAARWRAMRQGLAAQRDHQR